MGMIKIPFHSALVSFVEPVGPPQAYKTYTMRFPLKTHWRKATCEEADCRAFLFGWVTTVDIGTDLGQKQFYFITHDRERSCTVSQLNERLYEFTFGPGQRCYASSTHRVRLERVPKFLVTPGDFRAKVGPSRVHTRGEDWIDDFANHQDRLNTRLERG